LVSLTPYRLRRILTSQDRRKFIKLPWKIYAKDPHWIPPQVSRQKKFLDERHNPFLRDDSETCFFLLERGSEVIGRIVAIDNFRYRELYKEKTGFFGFFECIEDYGAAECLLNAARDWLNQRGLDRMIGPTNFTTNDESGLLIEGFDSPPSLAIPYTHRVYPAFFERFGLTKLKDVLVWSIDLTRPLSERMRRIASRIKAKGTFQIRPVNLDVYEKEKEALKEVFLSSSFQGYGELPWTEEEFYAIADEFRPLTVPDLSLIVEERGKPVAHSFSLPDYGPILSGMRGPFAFIKAIRFKQLARSVDRLRALSFQIHRDYQGRGIEAFLYMETMRAAKRLGYKETIVLALENYPINRQIQELGGTIEKRIRLYQYPAKTPETI
jgi:GNAT superfamily N-acetyltransferase